MQVDSQTYGSSIFLMIENICAQQKILLLLCGLVLASNSVWRLIGIAIVSQRARAKKSANARNMR